MKQGSPPIFDMENSEIKDLALVETVVGPCEASKSAIAQHKQMTQEDHQGTPIYFTLKSICSQDPAYPLSPHASNLLAMQRPQKKGKGRAETCLGLPNDFQWNRLVTP